MISYNAAVYKIYEIAQRTKYKINKNFNFVFCFCKTTRIDQGGAVLSRIIRSQIFGRVVGGGGDTCKTFGNAKLFVWHEMA